jgi:hypothetical protein
VNKIVEERPHAGKDFDFFRRLNGVKIGSPPMTGKGKGGPKKVGEGKAHNYVKPQLSTKRAEPDEIAKEALGSRASTCRSRPSHACGRRWNNVPRTGPYACEYRLLAPIDKAETYQQANARKLLDHCLKLKLKAVVRCRSLSRGSCTPPG